MRQVLSRGCIWRLSFSVREIEMYSFLINSFAPQQTDCLLHIRGDMALLCFRSDLFDESLRLVRSDFSSASMLLDKMPPSYPINNLSENILENTHTQNPAHTTPFHAPVT